MYVMALRANGQSDLTLMDLLSLAPTRFRTQARKGSTTTWTPQEDELLTKLVGNASSVSWSAIAPYFPNKTAPQLAGRWDKVINPRLVKGSWTHEEDQVIQNFVQEHGEKEWARLATLLHGRTGKQCRERYMNHLDEHVNRSGWSGEEDERLARLHAIYGNSWSKLATFFDGRTDNCIKNRWNSTIKKRIERMQRGEPLVFKRGRKPKAADNPLRYDSTSSSPLEPTVARAPLPSIEFLTLSPAMRAKVASVEPAPTTSLLQNRTDLERLLAQ
jgi:hypothetical protein